MEQSIPTPLLDIYISKISSGPELTDIWPPERMEQISRLKSPEAQKRSRAVWKLLEKAFALSFGLSIKEAEFSLSGGKWSCDKLHFSLSHTKDALAVAVSNLPCGVDIESGERFCNRYGSDERAGKMLRRICCPEEAAAAPGAEELIYLWTKKESIFKCSLSGVFLPKEINTLAAGCHSGNFFIPEEYVVSWCGEALPYSRVYLLENPEVKILY